MVVTGRGVGGHHRGHSGATDVWLTPPEVVAALGAFDLDPCGAPPPRPYETAARTIALPEDGLAEMWEGRVWLNPPYSEVGRWIERLVAHDRGTALVFARTDTRWWHRLVFEGASAVRFLEGRLHFHRPDGTRAPLNAGGPSAIVAYGRRDAEILRDATSLGGRCFVL